MAIRQGVRAAIVVMVVMLFGSLEGRAQNEPTPAKMAAIREFLEVTQATSMTTTIVDNLSGQMMRQILQGVPGMRKEHADELSALLSAEFRANADSLERLMVLLYDRHFSEEELMAATAFYRTPAGKSMLAKTPLVVQESFSIGQRWGAEIGQRAAQRAVQRGRALGYNL